MRRTAYDSTCTIARALDIVGPRWNLLILREAVNGVTRFADFRTLLGITPDVLSSRLADLVDAQVLERRTYQEPGDRPREEYVLTERGHDLKLVLAALQQWGDRYVPSDLGPTVVRRRHADDGTPDGVVGVGFVDDDGTQVPADQVVFEPRPDTPAFGRYEPYRHEAQDSLRR
ncbi:MAG: helix-turn-helix transcriptional regulator [Promicromonosporaceae bacterium]|nr:helix-turn-helix transcriptional regulator [Promicromonosporaceae bacterium]